MTKNKDTLEGRLQKGEPNSSITMETNLMELYQALRKEHHSAKRKDVVLHRAVCMLCNLYDEAKPRIVPRQVHTVEGLYSFTEEEILSFIGYGRKTWLKLNEWLPKYGLPPLKLPQEYTADQ